MSPSTQHGPTQVTKAWRCFPWNPEAADGEPFSAMYVPNTQGYGRFDLPHQPRGVQYLTETAPHAVGEFLARFRAAGLGRRDLLRFGHPQALVRVELNLDTDRIADLCDPDRLAQLRIAPDRLAVRDRAVTQPIAARIHDHPDRYQGLRWWSAYGGEWHTLALFRDRLGPDALRFGTPDPLQPDHPALRDAADWLEVRIQA